MPNSINSPVIQLVACLACFSMLHAQTVDDLLELSLEELTNVKITAASRSEKSIKNLPSTVHIITREEILNNHYFTLVDALRMSPSVRTAQPGTGSLGEKFFIRGLSGNDYVKILIDGVPISPSVVDGMPLGEQIDMRNIERIEIVYGPAAALYGADAMAGVINIVTFKPEASSSLLETYLGTSDEVHTRHTGVKLSMYQVSNKSVFNFHGGLSQKDDLNIVKNGNGFKDSRVYNENTEFNEMPAESFNFGLGFTMANWKLSYDHMVRVDHSSLEQPSHSYIYNNPELGYGETIQKATVTHQFRVNQLKSTCLFSYLRYRLDTESAFGLVFYSKPLYKYQASDDALWEETIEYQLNDNLEILGGLSFQYSGAMPKTSDLTKPFDENFYKPFSTEIPEQGTYQNTQFGDFGFNPFTYFNYGAFLQTTYTYDIFTLSSGVRFDDHSEYESEINPRLAGLVRFNQSTSVHLSYNEAFRAPTPYKVYDAFGYENGDGTVTYLRVPNEKLQPEKFREFEASLRHFFATNFFFEFSGFRHITTGLISVGTVSLDKAKYPNATPSQEETESNLNSPDAQSILNGFDVMVNMSNIVTPIKLNAQLYFSYAFGEESLPNGGTVDIYRNAPEYLIKLRLNARPIPNLYIGLDNLLHSEWYTKLKSAEDLNKPEFHSKGYLTTDLIANYKLPGSFGNFQLYFKLLNMFDQTYGGVRLKDNPQYQRSYYGGLSALF